MDETPEITYCYWCGAEHDKLDGLSCDDCGADPGFTPV